MNCIQDQRNRITKHSFLTVVPKSHITNNFIKNISFEITIIFQTKMNLTQACILAFKTQISYLMRKVRQGIIIIVLPVLSFIFLFEVSRLNKKKYI